MRAYTPSIPFSLPVQPLIVNMPQPRLVSRKRNT